MNAGAARMIGQEELSGERLAKEIISLIESPEEITRMETAARKLARKDAAAKAVNLIQELVMAQGKTNNYLTFGI